MGTSQFISSLSRGLAIALLLAWAPRAWAVDPTEWLIVQGINRGETSATWTSPTAVDLDEVAWQWDFEITRITGTVNLGVFGNVTEDMTGSFPEEFRVRSGVVGALPAVLIDDQSFAAAVSSCTPIPQIRAAFSAGYSSRSSSNSCHPSVWFSMNDRSTIPQSSSNFSRPFSIARSDPGRAAEGAV